MPVRFSGQGNGVRSDFPRTIGQQQPDSVVLNWTCGSVIQHPDLHLSLREAKVATDDDGCEACYELHNRRVDTISLDLAMHAG